MLESMYKVYVVVIMINIINGLVKLTIQTTILMMIVLLEYLTVILESIDLFLVYKAFLSPTLKILLYLMFTTENASVEFHAMISVPILMH